MLGLGGSKSGLYQEGIFPRSIPPGSTATPLASDGADLGHLRDATKSGDIKTAPHTLIIFASCGCSGHNRDSDDDAIGHYDSHSLAGEFGDHIRKDYLLSSSPVGESITYKVTTIAPTGLSFLFKGNGDAYTDGTWVKTEKVYQATKTSSGIDTSIIGTKATTLSSQTIDPGEIMNAHDPNDVTIK